MCSGMNPLSHQIIQSSLKVEKVCIICLFNFLKYCRCRLALASSQIISRAHSLSTSRLSKETKYMYLNLRFQEQEQWRL